MLSIDKIFVNITSNMILVHTTFIHRMSYELHLIVTTSNININLKYHISILLLQLIKINYHLHNIY